MLIEEQTTKHDSEFECIALSVALVLTERCAGDEYETLVQCEEEEEEEEDPAYYDMDLEDGGGCIPGCRIQLARLPHPDAFLRLADALLHEMTPRFVSLVKELMPASVGIPKECSVCLKWIPAELVHLINYNSEDDSFRMRASSLSVSILIPNLAVCQACGENLMDEPHELNRLLPIPVLD